MPLMHIPGHDKQKPQEVTLEEIRDVMGDCHLCPLWETRTNLVFGVGNPNARVMIVGEGPGRNEDLQGEPFVGAAGKNLDELLLLAGLRREDVYIGNVVKCRPPNNRNPRPEEIEACAPFLREQIRSIWPDVIVCLGNFASHFVLRTEMGITSLRGRFHQTGHFAVLPTSTLLQRCTIANGNRCWRMTSACWGLGWPSIRLVRAKVVRDDAYG